MSNPAGWKVIYFRLAFTMPLKILFSVILPVSGHFLPTCSLLLSLRAHLHFLRSFSPLFTSTHVPSTASSLVHTINICLSVDLCALHNNVLYCLSLSLPVPLINSQIHLRHVLVSHFRLLKLNKRPDVVHFSAVKHPGACRLARAENT